MPSREDAASILIVDDDEGLLILMADVLRGEGYDVATAKSGSAALKWLEGRTPSLMLLDLKLQDMDGTTLLKKIRENENHVSFIVVTGRGDEKVAVETMRQGGLDYVMKDTGLLDLLPAVVKRALEGIGRDRELVRAQAEGRRLEREIVAISEKERQTIGADLHDGLGQQLTAIELICAGLKDDVAEMRPDIRKRLDQVGKMLREAIGQTRLLARDLVPINDDPEGLHVALAELAERISSSVRISCRFEYSQQVHIDDPATAGHLYRISQEAVNNAIRHGNATEINITLGYRVGTSFLRITDNGEGMRKASTRSVGVGLRVMRHRASIIGAKLDIESSRGSGVTVTCTIPKKT